MEPAEPAEPAEVVSASAVPLLLPHAPEDRMAGVHKLPRVILREVGAVYRFMFTCNVSIHANMWPSMRHSVEEVALCRETVFVV